MNDTKNILKIWSVIGIVAAVFAVFSSLPHAKAAICVDCGGGGGGGGTVTVPVAPTLNYANSVAYSQVNLSFTDNSSNETGFYVYRAATLVATLPATAATGVVTTYSDTGMACGYNYLYGVAAYNSAGVASSTGIWASVVCPPTAPTLNSVTAINSTQLNLSWTTTSYIQAYIIFRDGVQVSSGGVESSGTVNTFTDTPVTCGVSHTYSIQVNAGGYSATSGNISGATTCPPTAPTINSIVGTALNVWKLTGTFNSTVDGYYLLKNGVAGSFTAIAGTSGTVVNISFNDSPACGTSDSFVLRATNGPYSADSAPSVLAGPACVSAPAPVASPIATPVPGNPSINSSWTGTFSGVRVYLKGPTGYSLAGDFASAIKATSFAGLKCPYPYTAYYVAYNTDSSVLGTDASCSSALTNAGISGPAAPTGAKCAAAASKPVDMRFCTQQFLGN